MVKLKKVATQVRQAFENISRQEYPYLKEHSLSGYCCRASAQLFLAAKRHGIEGVKIVVGHGHVYNVYQGHIVDITATQFGEKDPVYIKPFNEYFKTSWWRTISKPYDDLFIFSKNECPINPKLDFPHVMALDTSEDPFEEFPYM